MSISCVVVDFHLDGCRSLKEKRSALSGLRQRYGRQTNVAAFESAFADSTDRGQWSFIVAASAPGPVSSQINRMLESIESQVDALIVDVQTWQLD